MSEERSPLSPYALALQEVRDLAPGTHLTSFNMQLGPQKTYAYSHIDNGRIYGHPVKADGTVDSDSETSSFLSDCGLTPLSNGWNKVNVTILASNLDKMPEPPGRSRLITPWTMS